LEHPDLHWFFPLQRPKGTSSPEKLADAPESARAGALAELRENPLALPQADGPRGLYLAMAQTLRRRAQRRPSMGDRQVFIIADAEFLVPQESSPEAANALLKLLEEPPGGTTFILTSGDRDKILPTIRSRSVHLHLPPLANAEVQRFLEEVAGVDADTARRTARLSQGSIGRALGFLPQGEEPGPLEQLRQESLSLLEAAVSGQRGSAFTAALGYPIRGARTLQDLLSFLEEWLRDLAASAAGAPDQVLNHEDAELLNRFARERLTHPVRIAEAVAAVEEARVLAAGNVNPQLIISGLLQELRGAFQGSQPGSSGP
jgi:DNA polymerase-3 subunit delta'